MDSNPSLEEAKEMDVVELKELLHRKQIDSTGIFDKDTLIDLLFGLKQEQTIWELLPSAYIGLFDLEKARNCSAMDRIKEYLHNYKKSSEQKKESWNREHSGSYGVEISNVPRQLTTSDLHALLSKAGPIIDISPKAFSQLTQTILVQYMTQYSVKKCIELFHGVEISPGMNLEVRKEVASKEVVTIESAQLTCVLLLNLFTEKQLQDRNYMMDLRNDVEEECGHFGSIKGVVIDEQEFSIFIRFEEESIAIQCVKVMDGRLFDGRRITARLCKDPLMIVSEPEVKSEPIPEEDLLLNDFLASIAEEEKKRDPSIVS